MDAFCGDEKPHPEHPFQDGMCYGVEVDGSFPAGPHVFEISVRSRLAYADWWGDPYLLQVRAFDMRAALEIGSVTSFRDWTQPSEQLSPPGAPIFWEGGQPGHIYVAEAGPWWRRAWDWLAHEDNDWLAIPPLWPLLTVATLLVVVVGWII